MILAFIILLSVFLYLDRISELMPFIGDQAWFYLSARDTVLTGNIPLVGIASSQIWLHQGPLWTYVLAPFLYAFGFNPVAGVFATSIFGLLSILLFYKLCKEFFNERIALLTCLLFAFSPLVAFHIRMPYHTSPIPFFVILLFYSLAKWIKGNAFYFPVALLSLSILYNLELASVAFWPVVIFIFLYGAYKKQMFIKKILNRKIIVLSFLLATLPMIPILIYDLQSGFPQTLKFMSWMRIRLFDFIYALIFDMEAKMFNFSVLVFFLNKAESLFVPLGRLFVLLIMALIFIISLLELIKVRFLSPFSIIAYSTFTGLVAYFISGAESEAYLVMLFPGLIFLFAFSLSKLKPGLLGIIFACLIAIFNVYTLLTTNYLMNDRLTLEKKVAAAEEVLSLADGKKYNLIFKGSGEEFESSAMPYNYLTWWIGRNAPSSTTENLQLEVEEKSNEINIRIIE